MAGLSSANLHPALASALENAVSLKLPQKLVPIPVLYSEFLLKEGEDFAALKLAFYRLLPLVVLEGGCHLSVKEGYFSHRIYFDTRGISAR